MPISFPGALKIRGSAWYTLFMHVQLPMFSEELGNYCTRLHVARSCIIGVLESLHVMAVNCRKEAAFSQAIPYSLGKKFYPVDT